MESVEKSDSARRVWIFTTSVSGGQCWDTLFFMWTVWEKCVGKTAETVRGRAVSGKCGFIHRSRQGRAVHISTAGLGGAPRMVRMGKSAGGRRWKFPTAENIRGIGKNAGNRIGYPHGIHSLPEVFHRDINSLWKTCGEKVEKRWKGEDMHGK